MSGFWSCRIDEASRFPYAVDDNYPTIIACRDHY
ncbi:MAG: type II toxin-antitoxin system YoeB family toxin [Candidatus Promineifilaceae bacterium]